MNDLRTDAALQSAISSVPSGAWAVGVSGGADSVALLLLLRQRPDLTLHVVHLDHETRGDESTADAAFVKDLADRLRVASTIARRSDVEATMTEIPANASSRYRAARLALFRRVVAEHNLAGVILAHHAGDQAETVLHRLLRGSGPMGLAAMEPSTDLGGLRIIRPLLDVTRDALRTFLASTGQLWREDASNATDDYLRNRLRKWLAAEPLMAADLLDLGEACRAMRAWARDAAPRLEASFPAAQLSGLPSVLAVESARRWLIQNRVPPEKISPAVIDQLLTMAADGASSPRAHFPGEVLVRRRKGMISRDSGRH
jgi:tRNA(Ile)-lysidine synthase